MRRRMLTLVPLVAAAVLAPTTSAHALPAPATAAPATTASAPASVAPDPFVTAMSSTLTTSANTSKYLKGAFSGIVVDPATGAVLWQYNAAHPHMPASTEKLLTTYTVLHSLDVDSTLTTRVLRRTTTDADGIVSTVVYLRGGGDPSLTVGRVTALAQQTAAQLLTDGQGEVTVVVDRSIFPDPTPAPGWKAGYLDGDVQLVQGLTLAGYRRPDGALNAGLVFSKALAAAGVIATPVGLGVTPSDAVEVATSSSAPVRMLLALMLSVSVNDYAEYLLRHAALARGVAPTWAGAVANERALLAAAGVPLVGLRAYDGSGLSRGNRMLPATLAAVVRLLWTTPKDADIAFGWGAMPRAGQTGTLARRYQDPAHLCAAGEVFAKTGSLTDAASLAGVAKGVDGVDRVFVFLDDGLPGKYTAVSSALDTMATTVVGCRLTFG